MIRKPAFALVCAACLFVFSVGESSAQKYMGDFTSDTLTGNEVTVWADSSAIRFIFYKPNIVRVDYLPARSTRFPHSPVVLPDSRQNVVVHVVGNDTSLSVRTSRLSIELSKNPVRVSFCGIGGKSLLSEPAAGGLSCNESKRSMRFSIQSGEHYYGTGERGLSFDLRGLALTVIMSSTVGIRATASRLR